MSRAPLTPEHRAKISASMRGHAVAPETVAKIAARRQFSPETRAAMAERADRRRMVRDEFGRFLRGRAE